MHKVLVNGFVKLTHDKRVVRLTDRLDMTIDVDWDIKQQTKQSLNKKIRSNKTKPLIPNLNILS